MCVLQATSINLHTFTYPERPDLVEQIEGADTSAFPEFLLNDSVWNECWPRVISDFADLQTVVYDADRDVVVGGSNAVAFRWDGTHADLPKGTHDAMHRALREHELAITPNTVCGIQAIATPEARGHGLSEAFVDLATRRLKDRGFERSLTPLRLLLKDRYPTISIDDYVEWQTPEGAPFDPWLRVWSRAGATIWGVCHDSLVIEAAIPDWERWLDLELPGSGRYVITGGQVLLDVDADSGKARYSEPHVWIELALAGS